MITGIICEYNPFHRGHAAMLEKVRQSGGDTVVCAMSGNFVQRGESAAFSKFARAEMALRGGADLVLELPTPWAMSPAETFARGGVEILSLAGCDTIAFGSECGNTAALAQVAQVLLQPNFAEKVKEKLAAGVTYAAARQQAAEMYSEAASSILSHPNDILAVEYLKAIDQQKADIKPTAIPRIGVDHDGGTGGKYASASYVRERLRKGEKREAFEYIPEYCADIIQREIENGRMIESEKQEIAILSRLRQLSEEDFARFDFGGEGLYHRLYDAVHSAAAMEELLTLAKTRRYPMARLRRMILAAWLNLPPAAAHIPYLRVLAADEKGRALLRKLQKEEKPVLTKPSDVKNISAEAERLFAAEAAWTDQFLLGMTAPQKPGQDWRYTPLMR